MKQFLLSILFFSLNSSVLFSQNLIVNGDFTSGNTGFTSDYQYLNPTNIAGTEGKYGVKTNPNSWFNVYSSCGDHTNGTGNMLVVNGSILNAGNDIVWSQTIPVTAGKNYNFTYWIQSVGATNPASIETVINGVSVAAAVVAPVTIVCGNWLKVSTTWNSGISTSAQIRLYDRVFTAAGNDFAIDDISFISLPTATITGTNTVCQNSLGNNIILTGADGIAPYTFVYNINGASNISVTTIVGNSISVPVPTSVVGTFNYNLVSVSYSTAPVISQTQVGIATIDVISLPTATITSSGTVCTGTTGTITFNGTPGATVTYTENYGSNQTILLDATGTAVIVSPIITANRVYDLVSITSNGVPNCSQPLIGFATLVVPTASFFGSTSINPEVSVPITFFGTPGATINFTSTLGPNSVVLNASGIGYYNIPYLNATTSFTLVSAVLGICSTPLVGSVTITVNTFCSIPESDLPIAEVVIQAPQAVCNPGECTELLARYTRISNTTDYDVCSVNYAPSFPFTGGTVINAVGDDFWSPVVNLPFSFNFYGVCYNTVLVGTNGVITFDLVNQVASGYCNWPFTATIPNAAFPIRNAIYGVYQDTNIASPPVTNVAIQNVNYYVLDTGVNAAPNRVFVANFNELPQFSCNAGVGFQTSQIVIHETTNIIDILVSKRTSCVGWNSGSGLIGIQNQGGNLAKFPPGRNTGTWAATNEAWRFYPKTTPAAASSELSWLLDGLPIGSINENPLNICPTGPGIYTAVVKYNSCSTVSVTDSFAVDVAPPLPVLNPQDITLCTSNLPPYTIDINQTAYILSGVPIADQGNYVIKYYERLDDAKNDAPTNINFVSDLPLSTFSVPVVPKKIYVRLEDLVVTGCYNIRSFDIIVTASPSGTISYPSSPYCNNIATPQPITETGLTSGGVYSAIPAGLVINPSSGAITPLGSTIGIYTVKYSLAATPDCPAYSTTTTVEIIGCSCTVVASATTQTVCINTAITPMTFTVLGGASGGSISAGTLPTGVTGSLAAGVYTLSGSPSVAGVYNFTVSINFGPVDVCVIAVTMTVTANTTLTLTSPAVTTNQSLCINTPITAITYTVASGGTGASVVGLPAGVTGNYLAGVFTISGTPSVAGVFNYTVTTTGGCSSASLGGTITVNPNATITLSSAPATSNQTLCINTPITAITYSVASGGTGASVVGLPAGVTGVYLAGVFTISGTPSVAGVFNYTVTTTGGCSSASLGGTITVNPNATITLSSVPATSNQTLCINTPITAITYSVASGGTGASVVGLPVGITGVYLAGVFTISGTPSVAGVFNYTVTTTGGCSTASLGGTITVSPNVTIALTSAATTTNQTLCINTAIVPITYALANTGLTGASVVGLPAGVTGVYLAGVFTISGTPSVAGVFNYTVTTTGGCSSASLGGTMTVNPNATITLSSAPATSNQTLCINTPITAITYSVGSGGTGASVVGLPAGVTGIYLAGVFTISGTPSVAGVFNYTVTTTGGCSTASLGGTITVSPNVTIALTSAATTTNQTLCINTAIVPITYALANTGLTGASVVGLPAGVTGTYLAGVFTISGTPSVAGVFNYTVTTTGGCSSASLGGTMTVNPNATITLSSAPATSNQTLCINTPITAITYSVGSGGTGASVVGLPVGVTGVYLAGVFTISGTPSVAGVFNYTVTTTGGCSSASLGGTITVSPNVTIALTSAATTTNQTLCINTAIVPITYALANTGLTGASVVGLPAGVTGTYLAGVFTISGTPSVAGVFNYTVTTTGGCSSASLSGTITVNPNATITLTSASATSNQTLCINTPITAITYSVANGGTGASVVGLPVGVTGVYLAGVFTISGTPSVAGVFNYTVTTTGGCSSASLSGTITVNPNATITLSSVPATSNQTLCINTPITAITYSVASGGTGASVVGLPVGVTGTYLAGVFTISGSTSVLGVYNYTVTTTGGCSTASLGGTITVSPNVTIALTSAPTTTNQTLCINTAIVPITYALANTGLTGATVLGLPAGVTGTYLAGVFTIGGTPSVAGVFNYTVTTTGGCSSASLGGTITVNPNTTITLSSAPATSNQTLCINTPITAITYSVASGGTGASVVGLPAGVTGVYLAGVFTISGTPSVAGVFNYTVTTTGGCSTASLGGTITVSPNVTIALTSAPTTTNQTLCINTAIVPITYALANTGLTGATVLGLPAGVTGTYLAGVFTISGTPSVAGVFNYTVTTTGGCSSASLGGTMTVNPNATITLSSAPATSNQTLCINTPITAITYSVANGGTGASVVGLPVGVTGVYLAGVFTISGTPSVAGVFNYTVTTTGGCSTASLGGTITVSPNVTIALTSAATTTNQTLCINTAIVPITYALANTGLTGASVVGLPAGVTGTYLAGVFTISGTPSVTGVFNYTVTTTGGCSSASLSGTITVNPNATITLTSASATSNQTICINTPILAIRYTIGNGATGASITSGALPAGITGSFVAGVFTISGTAITSGTFNFVVSTSGGCSFATLSGTIIVNPNASILLTSANTTANQTVCLNSTIAPITYSIANGATGATLTGLPSGVSGTYTSGIFTISGSSSLVGVFNYTLTTIGGCSSASLAGTLTVSTNVTISLTSALLTDSQSICINDPITAITYGVATGATAASITSGSLPSGISGAFSAGVFTITGTPTESGTFAYTVTTSGGCSTASLTGSITVNSLPVIALENGFICLDSDGMPISTYTINTNLSAATYSFVWSDSNGVIAGETGSSYVATAIGTYTVIVTNTTTPTPCSASASVTVIPSLPPLAAVASISSYFTQDQVITVNVSPPTGVYEYQLDNGPFQSSNQFTNLVSGIHSIIVKNGCGELAPITIRIIDYPKFFTPNGDGYNDTWNIFDLSDQANAKIYIFDRFGKFLKEISTTGEGWNGTFNLQQMPSTDYWFKVFYEELGIPKEFKSHFSLKR